MYTALLSCLFSAFCFALIFDLLYMISNYVTSLPNLVIYLHIRMQIEIHIQIFNDILAT